MQEATTSTSRYGSHRSLLKIFLALTAIYLCMIARWGYEYGRNDQLQIISYAMQMNDNSLFEQDHFVQDISSKVPNERYVFAKFMSFFGDYMPEASLFLHYLFTLLLLLMLFRIGQLFMESDYLIWLALLTLFIPLYGFNLGGNELYYNTFFVSTPAKAIALFGMLLFLQNRYALAYLIFGLAAILQPIVGLQLFLLCTAILCIGKLMKRHDYAWGKMLKWAASFLLTGGLWILFMKFFFEEKGGDDATFYTIFFEFRAPHHYLPNVFPLKSYLLLIPLLSVGFYFYKKNNYKLTLFFLLSLAGMLFYTIGVLGLNNVTIATLQGFKTTIWLKAFSVLAVFALAEQALDWLKEERWIKLAYPTLLSAGLGVLVLLTFGRQYITWPVPFDFGQQYLEDPAVLISKTAKVSTPKDALFLHPIDFTELKVYGERSAYVDYKALAHRKKAMEEWYERMYKAYKVNRQTQLDGQAVHPTARTNFAKLGEADLRKLHKEEGITHLITYKEHKLDFRILAKNEVYVIYEL